MTSSKDISERVRRYFQVKSRQLAAIADLAICEHSGLAGSHREQIQRVHLSEILPKRFETGKGMVYGPHHRSHEADIVIWDAQNYPSLPISDHSFFFADSVRAVLECKSSWGSEEMGDVLIKCRAVRDIVAMTSELNLADEVEKLKQQVAALQQGLVYEGMILTRHHIGTAAVFLTGGQTFSSGWITPEVARQLDDAWPDILLLLEPGLVITKNYKPTDGFCGYGWLEFYELGEDSLLVFTASLLALITERSVQVEDPLYIWKYSTEVADVQPVDTVELSITRPIAQRSPIWRSTNTL